jgi:Leucine-rich repeat (LRR) protein
MATTKLVSRPGQQFDNFSHHCDPDIFFISPKGSFREYLASLIFEVLSFQEVFILRMNMKELPISICSMPFLKVLDLSGNCLETLPNEFAQLVNLEQIRLRGNSFSEFPKVLFQLPKLREIEIDLGLVQLTMIME